MLIFKIKYLFLMYMCAHVCAHICVHTMGIQVLRKPVEDIRSLDLELQAVVSCLMCVGNWTQILCMYYKYS